MIYKDAGPYQFTYDETSSYETNFSLWSSINTEERLAYNEEPYTLQEQKEIFSKLYAEKAWLRSFFCYTICIG